MAEKLMKEFQQVNDEASDHYNNGTFEEACKKLFTEDCRMMAPGNDVMIGWEGAARVPKDFKKAGGGKLKWTTVEIVPMGDDIAIDRGSYTLYTKDGEVFDEGKYVTLRKKVNGIWLYHFDIFNSNKA